MGDEACPSCSGKQIRLSADWGRHYLRCMIGSRKRFCVSCKSRWTASAKGGWPVPARIALLLVPIVAARGAAHFHRPELEHAPIYVRQQAPAPGSASASDADADPGAQGDASIPGLAEDPKEIHSTAQWLRAHQNDPAAPAGPPIQRKPGMLGTLSMLSDLIKHSLGFNNGMSQAQIDSLLKQDKHKLWDQYGHYFSSKEEAKAAYEQAKKESEKQHAAAP